jgi:hypothetical protein
MSPLPRENVYGCEYGCLTVTVDVDVGVTPFMIKCRSVSRPDRPLLARLTGPDGECVGIAESCFYPKKRRPPHIPEPTHEWYKPENIDGLSPQEIEHVNQGGLLLRPRTNRHPIYHAEDGEK